MKKIILYTLLFIVADVLLFLLLVFIGAKFIKGTGDYDFGGLFFVLISSLVLLLLELIVGGILAMRQRTMEVGKGLLLSAAIALLFGLSVCSSMWS
jgi:hypothetical protein